MRLGADLAAILTERDLFRHSGAERAIDDPDISERVEALWRGGRGRRRAGRSTRPRSGRWTDVPAAPSFGWWYDNGDSQGRS